MVELQSSGQFRCGLELTRIRLADSLRHKASGLIPCRRETLLPVAATSFAVRLMTGRSDVPEPGSRAISAVFAQSCIALADFVLNLLTAKKMTNGISSVAASGKSNKICLKHTNKVCDWRLFYTRKFTVDC